MNEYIIAVNKIKKSRYKTALNFLVGRGGEIRTHGLLYPKQARYQTAPRPDSVLITATKCIIDNKWENVNTFLKIF